MIVEKIYANQITAQFSRHNYAIRNSGVFNHLLFNPLFSADK